MEAPAHIELQGLSKTEREALVTLLGDEDPRVYAAVQSRILRSGSEAREWLRPVTLSNDPILRRRARRLIATIGRHGADHRFLAFCLSAGVNFDLERSLWLLAQTRYPEISVDAYSALLDTFTEELRENRVRSTTQAIIAVINSYLFEDLRFHGNHQRYYDPENSYLNRVIDRRTGNPISLCAFYWILARRLGLPVVGIGMPSHFLCRYQTSTEAFYIDVFHQGRILNQVDCIRFLREAGFGFERGYLTPSSPRATLQRMCNNLRQIYTQLELKEETALMNSYLVALLK